MEASGGFSADGYLPVLPLGKLIPESTRTNQLQDSPNKIMLQLALTGLDLNADFTFSANYFNQTERHDLQHCLNKVTEETGVSFEEKAPARTNFNNPSIQPETSG